MSKSESIQYAMLKKALRDVTNDNTKKAYKHDIKEFASWVRSQGMKSVADIYTAVVPSDADERKRLAEKYGLQTAEDLCLYSARQVVQCYRDEVIIKQTCSPSTEHRKIAAICKGLGICRPRGKDDPMWTSRIITTRRTSDKITRGRMPEKNHQGKREIEKEKYSRLVNFQKSVGIRRDELRRRDLVTDESGYLCVLVERGKGDKRQMQRILPDDLEIVKKTFEGIAPDQFVFSQEEMNNKINLHRLRSEHAKKTYAFYQSILKTPEDYKQLADELRARFEACREDSFGRTRFANVIKDALVKPVYRIRGKNKQRAIALKLPTEYKKLALLATSVFALSHWRLSVATTNYIIQ